MAWTIRISQQPTLLLSTPSGVIILSVLSPDFPCKLQGQRVPLLLIHCEISQEWLDLVHLPPLLYAEQVREARCRLQWQRRDREIGQQVAFPAVADRRLCCVCDIETLLE